MEAEFAFSTTAMLMRAILSSDGTHQVYREKQTHNYSSDANWMHRD